MCPRRPRGAWVPASAPTKSAARDARRAVEAGVVGGARTRGRGKEDEEGDFCEREEGREEDEKEEEDEDFLEKVMSASARLSSPGPPAKHRLHAVAREPLGEGHDIAR